jgi:Ulp1 family protease
MQKTLSHKNSDQFHCLNSFFFSKLIQVAKLQLPQAVYNRLQRWMQGINILQKDYIFLPITSRCV